MVSDIPSTGRVGGVMNCECGCGKQAPIAQRTSRKKGHVRGERVRFLQGHGGARGKVSIPARNRFWGRVDRGAPDECWPWLGKTSPYGTIRERKESTLAHRMAYELANGPIPASAVVRHTCDNPPCCNPAHLLVGTHADNSHDAVVRGRTARGERVASSRLKAVQVIEIRRLRREGWTQVELAERFNVGRMAIRGVISGKTWQHVEGVAS
jgi:hypothetical protein